jgi:catechol 2,3-dioxygenase-like lactoylglutathione lyase family enzyme
MLLNHIGIISHSAELADRFYIDFLGLHKAKESVLPLELSEQIFSVSKEIEMIVYERNRIKIEVFVCPECTRPSPDFSHIGLYVDDLKAVIDKAKEFDVKHIAGQKDNKTVHFLKDFSGNLIEVKQI